MKKLIIALALITSYGMQGAAFSDRPGKASTSGRASSEEPSSCYLLFAYKISSIQKALDAGCNIHTSRTGAWISAPPSYEREDRLSPLLHHVRDEASLNPTSREAIVKFLLNNHANIDSQSDNNHLTALMFVIMEPMERLEGYFYGAPRETMQPVHRQQNFNLFKLLLDHDPNLQIKDKQGHDIFWYAKRIKAEYPEYLKILHEAAQKQIRAAAMVPVEELTPEEKERGMRNIVNPHLRAIIGEYAGPGAELELEAAAGAGAAAAASE